MHKKMSNGHYGRLAIMIVVSFVAMYVLMYAMVDSVSNVVNNINQVYMAGLMAAAMTVIELVFMRAMYHKKNWNIAIVAVSVLALVGFWMGIRQQLGVGDEQFLRSMIPHHAAAILMCQQATIRDPDVTQLCGDIVSSQQREIDVMKAKLKEEN
jgi:uncharacterized protein (DUF305 family)